MTDGDAANLARRIDEWNWKIVLAMEELRKHPNGQAMMDRMVDNGFGTPSLAEHVVHEQFQHPEAWDVDEFRIAHRGAKRAVATRRGSR